MKTLEDLFTLWQDGSITREELADFKTHLTHNAGRAKLVEDFFMNAVILETLRDEKWVSALFRKRGRAVRGARTRPLAVWLGAMAAACLVLAIGGSIYRMRQLGVSREQAAPSRVVKMPEPSIAHEPTRPETPDEIGQQIVRADPEVPAGTTQLEPSATSPSDVEPASRTLVQEPQDTEPESPVDIPAETRQPGVLVEKPGPEEKPAFPAKVQTERPAGRVVVVIASAYYERRRSRKWFKVMEGMYLGEGDSIDTRIGALRMALPSGSTIYCNKSTWITFEKANIHLRKGEIYCDIVSDGTPFSVATGDGTIRSLGTRFLVKVLPSGTSVMVEEGRVEAGNEKGGIEVAAGFQASMRKGREPGKTSRVDTVRPLAWLNSIKKMLFCFNFEEGGRPAMWNLGSVTKGPGHPGSTFCLEGEPCEKNPDGYTTRINRSELGILTYLDGLVLNFDYWVGVKARLLSVQVTNKTQAQNYCMDLDKFQPGSWNRATIRLEDMQPMSDKTRRFMPGDVISGIEFYIKKKKKGPLYIDNVIVTLYASNRSPQTSGR